VDRQRDPLVSARHDVAHRVASKDCDATLVQPRQAARVEAGHPLAKRIPSAFRFASGRAAGADQQHVAFFDVDLFAPFRRRSRSSGKIGVPGSSQSTFFEARNIEQDAAADDALRGVTSISRTFFAPCEADFLGVETVVHLVFPEHVAESASRCVLAMPCGPRFAKIIARIGKRLFVRVAPRLNHQMRHRGGIVGRGNSCERGGRSKRSRRFAPAGRQRRAFYR